MLKFDDDGLHSAVEDLEAQVEYLTRRLESLESIVADMRALGEDFWREEAGVLLVGAAVRSWHYDAHNENTLFADVYPCEVFGEGHAKRWVGRSGEIGATVALNRAGPLVFSLRVQGFSTPGLERTLNLEIDGETVPWTAVDGDLWSALIDDRPGQARLRFRLTVDTAQMPAEKDVSFAFSDIHIGPPPAYERAPRRAVTMNVIPLMASGGAE